jgi:hypothetical protein
MEPLSSFPALLLAGVLVQYCGDVWQEWCGWLPLVLAPSELSSAMNMPLVSEERLPDLLILKIGITCSPLCITYTPLLQCRAPTGFESKSLYWANLFPEVGTCCASEVKSPWWSRDGNMQGFLTPRVVQIPTIGPSLAFFRARLQAEIMLLIKWNYKSFQ